MGNLCGGSSQPIKKLQGLVKLKTDMIGEDKSFETYNEASELLEEIKLQIKYGSRRAREKSLVSECL